MDFDEAADQTTPWEWTDPEIPGWMRMSFHDHPPLVFWIQHLSILVFGENNFALRFPSAILGVLSVYILYLIGERIFSERAGLLGAFLMAVTLNSVYISRTGMQEPYVIFFTLLSSYLFLKSLEKENYLIWLGAALGFGFLAKYNTFILGPIFLTYLAFFRRDYFLNKKLWQGAFLSVAIFSPVIIYNIKLYQAVGHFDFQFSYIFGQNPEVWGVAPGKEIGTMAERARSFIPRLISSNSWLYLTAFSLVFLAGLGTFIKKPEKFLKENAFLLIVFAYLLLLLAVIGPSYRFLTMLTPFMVLTMAILFDYLYRIWPQKRLWAVLFAVFIAFEIFYAFNNQIAYYPVGPSPWLSSKVRYENYNWGHNALGDFFEKEFKGRMPAIRFEAQYDFIEKAQDRSLERAQKLGFGPYPAMVVTYGNFDRGAKLWVLDRLHIYHGWPIISFDTYLSYMKENGADYYKRVGFKYYYFVLSSNIAPTSEFLARIQKNQPMGILNPRGDEAFRVYKLSSADY